MTGGKRSRLPLALLVAVHGAVLFAGFLAPYDFAEQNRTLAFAPPSRLRFFDSSGRFHLRPFIYDWTPRADGAGYDEDRARMWPLRFFVAGAPYRLAGVVTLRLHLFGVEEPGRIFLAGSDAYGRDVFSRLLWGGQFSLFAGLLAASLSLGIGLALGAVAGFYGKWLDEGIMRGAELFLALPWLYLLFAVRAFLPLNISAYQAFLLLVTVIGIVGWARPARLIRGIVLSAKERDYVLAARGFGASDVYLLRRHVLPQALGVVLTQAAVLAPHYMLAEVTLSFLGLGVPEPAPSWGNMLSAVQQYYVVSTYWWILLPGLVMVPVFFAYFRVADAWQKLEWE